VVDGFQALPAAPLCCFGEFVFLYPTCPLIQSLMSGVLGSILLSFAES
jgi:hypothetical protein